MHRNPQNKKEEGRQQWTCIVAVLLFVYPKAISSAFSHGKRSLPSRKNSKVKEGWIGDLTKMNVSCESYNFHNKTLSIKEPREHQAAGSSWTQLLASWQRHARLGVTVFCLSRRKSFMQSPSWGFTKPLTYSSISNMLTI